MNAALRPEMLLSAYANGIFPMADSNGELQWFAPDPRAIIPLHGLVVSRSLRSVIRRGKFTIRVNNDFNAVIRACADRPEGTWISDEIVHAYSLLHRLGFAHSVEAWHKGELAGGLYGVAIGGAFFGESMFYRVTDASKVAMAHLVQRMKEHGLVLLDTQFITDHLRRLGAIEISRNDYETRLADAIQMPVRFADKPPAKNVECRIANNE